MATTYSDCVICIDCKLAATEDDLIHVPQAALIKRFLTGQGFPIQSFHIIPEGQAYPFGADPCEACGSYLPGERMNATIIVN